MKKWLFLVPLLLGLSLFCSGQAVTTLDQNCNLWGANPTTQQCGGTTSAVSGTQLFFPDIRGTITNQFEVLVQGTAPATLTVTVVGCMRGGTCSSTLASSSGTASQILTPAVGSLNVYDKYGITVSWTGGDATTRFVVNRTGTVAKLSGGAVPAGATNVIQKNGGGSSFAASSITDNGTIVSSTEPFQGPSGSLTNPTWSFTGFTTTGMYVNTNYGLALANGGNDIFGIGANTAKFTSSIPLQWQSTTSPLVAAGVDTGISRSAAGVLAVGNGSALDTTGKIKASAYMSVGTKFTASGCANSTLVGGSTAGTYTSITAGSCTVTITFGDSATSPTGWVCDAHDLTTVADANNITMGTSTTTTANLVEGTVVANDVIAFKCTGY